MKKQTKNTRKKQNKQSKHQIDLFTEIVGVCLIGLGLLIVMSLLTKQVGIVGEGIRTLFLGLFGIGGYFIALYSLAVGILYMRGDFKKLINVTKYTIPFIGIAMCGFHFIAFFNNQGPSLWGVDYIKVGSWQNGGWFGALLGEMMDMLFGKYGSIIVWVVISGIWLLVVTQFPVFSWLQAKLGKKIMNLQQYLQHKIKKSNDKIDNKKKIKIKRAIESKEEAVEHPPIIINGTDHPIEPVPIGLEQVQNEKQEVEKVEKTKVTQQEIASTWEEIKSNETLHTQDYIFPSLELLAKKESKQYGKNSSRSALHQAKKLEDTLLSFGVDAKVTQINQGPTVTRYELQPKQGVKVSKIVNLADDIALNLAASGIRIEAPIPGKAAVGIEVPNEVSEAVYLREVIDTDQFVAFPSKLAFSLGRDISGKPIIADISKMPHLLIAGATGSGKSVCINTLITSILYKAKPSEVRLIMIDPKVVELNVYNGIPHLLIPVVTDPKKAAGALCWAVNEMTKRYQAFAENNVRDRVGYNNKMINEEDKMPSIVIIIDELADLMMTAAKEVEDAICRLAQMARAAGIHLVIATQRPSVDVITGVIKANIPSRLAFAVSSGIDSRTILDMNGAEKLLGKGDMLFNPIGESKPIRIQGAFVSDKEVESIVEAVKSTGDVQYEEDIIETLSNPTIEIESGEEDELIPQAIQLAVGKEKMSISMLQRYFRIGFNRASRLMDALEARGVVGPDEGSKPRKVIQTLPKGEE